MSSSKRSDITSFLLDSVASVEDVVDARWRRLKRRLGWTGQPQIVAYTGYANDRRAWLHGRVLTNPPKDLPDEDDGWWDNLTAMYQRIESDEVPGVEVAIDFAGRRHVVTSDEEGYIRLEADRHDLGPHHGLWTSAAMRIVGPADLKPDGHTVTIRLMTPQPGASFGVISDVDDTVLQTGVVNLLTMARHTFFHNARTRKPLAGVAAWYRALQGLDDRGTPNPIWYVSSSPWNLHDLLEDFLDLNGIPPGPLLLRDLGLGGRADTIGGHGHKLEKALRIMDAFPDLPFVLIGDSGQEDANLYASAAEQRPESIRAIFIRDVDPDIASHRDDAVGAAIRRAEVVGVPMFLVADSVAAFDHCVRLGLLTNAERSAVVADTRRDQD